MSSADTMILGEIDQYGHIATAKIPGIQTAEAVGVITSSGSILAGINAPVAAFDDFALFGVSDPDPAMVLVQQVGPTTTGAYGAPWNRNYMVVTPPEHYTTSGSTKAWSRAAFASLGFRFTGVTAQNWQYLEDVQYEELPLNLTAPTGYTTPRRIEMRVRPDRLNHIKNPSIPGVTTNWSTVGASTALAADTTFAHSGTHSAKVTVNTAGVRAGATMVLDDLIPGRQYCASAYIVPGAGIGDVRIMVASKGDRSLTGETLSTSTDVKGQFTRIWATFVASASTETLQIGVASNNTATAKSFWFDDVLCEEGTLPRTYFDGSMGYDYLWEVGGTVGLARSYHYGQRKEKSYLVKTLLDENTPVGIDSMDPLFAVPLNS